MDTRLSIVGLSLILGRRGQFTFPQSARLPLQRRHMLGLETIFITSRINLKYMKWPILTAVLVVVISGCVSQSGFTGTTIKGDEIVFASDKYSTGNELYLMNPDGSDIRRLTWNEDEDNNPAFSPDKKAIAFHRATDPADYSSYEIYILDLETGEETRVTNNLYLDGHPDWSPDGTRLVFARYDGTTPEADLYVIDLDEGVSSMHRITENDPEWSPDGSRIVFKSTRHTNESGKDEIYVMDPDGSNERRLTNVTGWQSDHDPSWSADSEHIYFERFEGTVPWYRLQETYYFLASWQTLTPWNIYSVDLNGTEEKLTDCDYICWLPVQYGDMVMFLKDDFVLYNGTLVAIQVEYATIAEDGTNETMLLSSDEYEYNKAYFDF